MADPKLAELQEWLSRFKAGGVRSPFTAMKIELVRLGFFDGMGGEEDEALDAVFDAAEGVRGVEEDDDDAY